MAIGAATVWRVRPSGNSANGAGYDATISGAGTDYSQQNTAQYAAADLTGTTSTVVSATAGFTSAMVGNAMQITGGGATAGFYFIITFTNSTTVVLDRSPGTITNATFKVGGGITAPFLLMDSSKSAGNKAVAGNTIYILGAGGAPDYSITPIQANPPVSGDTTSGAIRMIGEGTLPVTIWLSSGDNYMANGGTNLQFQNISFKPSAASNSRLFDTAATWLFLNCVFNMNNINTSVGLGSGTYMNCEFFSRTGSAPTAFATGCVQAGEVTFIGCNFHDLGLYAWTAAANSTTTLCALNCVFSSPNQTSNKPYLLNNTTDTSAISIIMNCTFDKNSTDAIQLSSSTAIATTVILNNIFSNNTGGSGINCTVNTTALNDRLKLYQNYNDYFNNSSDVAAISKGANDLALDPQYTSEPSNLNLAGVNLRSQSFPGAAVTGSTTERNYADLGALQAPQNPVGQVVKVASIGTY